MSSLKGRPLLFFLFALLRFCPHSAPIGFLSLIERDTRISAEGEAEALKRRKSKGQALESPWSNQGLTYQPEFWVHLARLQ